jgi:hypothetical protein
MTPLPQQMMAALQLSSHSERTPLTSVRAVRLLAQFYRKAPALIAAQEWQHNIFHRTNVDRLSPSSLRLGCRGSRGFSLYVLERNWKLLDLMRAPYAYRLPAVRRVQAGRRLLRMATPLPNRVACPPVYSWGLRLHAGLLLQGSDRDGQRRMVHAPRGQGAKDRDGPRPQDT